ncbi:MAG: VIT and VWA domain-containing protein [Desulfobacterales bacterium]|nr:VIT and VWA domain-containing protein [Desulfobacterales bacterium]
MKQKIKHMNRLFFMTIFFIVIMLSNVQAAGLLKSKNSINDSISMKSHHVNVTINNGFARTEVDQVFINTGDRDLEATYTFPVPKKASMSELSLWIDGREVIGEVLEKGTARKIYEDQAAKGEDTAIAEKDDYKTFNIIVSPVRSQNETRVRLVYYQPLEIDLNIGRYVYPLEEGGVDEERISFWSVDDSVKSSFKFDLQLKSAFPLKDVRLPGYQNRAIIHKAENTDKGNGVGEVYSISLDQLEGASLSSDIVLYYRLDENTPARVELVPYKAGKNSEGTFMVVVTPGASLQRISEGTDWTFVLDTSGSMGGNKIATLTDGVCNVIKKMNSQDRFRIVTFNNSARDFSGGYIQATQENVNRMALQVKKIQAGGGTALFEGLERAYVGLDADRTSGIILVTDGVANIGPSKQNELLELHRKYDLRLFTFVIGNSVNQPLLDALAKESGGFAMNISTSDDMIGRIIQARAKMRHECIYDADIKFSGEKVKMLTPEKIGNLYMGQQLVKFGKYSGTGSLEVKFSGKVSGERKVWTCQAYFPEKDADNPELERLWALSRIDEEMQVIREKGETPGRRNKVVDLGTQNSLVTDYTSMVVVKESAMEGLGIRRNNANRVNTEREAQAIKAQQPVHSYRVDQNNGSGSSSGQGQKQDSGGMFGNSRSHDISFGTGPVGPIFIGAAYWLRRRKNRK